MQYVFKWHLFKKSFKLRNLIKIHSSKELLLLEQRHTNIQSNSDITTMKFTKLQCGECG
jgi:hypothetical protein